MGPLKLSDAKELYAPLELYPIPESFNVRTLIRADHNGNKLPALKRLLGIKSRYLFNQPHGKNIEDVHGFLRLAMDESQMIVQALLQNKDICKILQTSPETVVLETLKHAARLNLKQTICDIAAIVWPGDEPKYPQCILDNKFLATCLGLEQKVMLNIYEGLANNLKNGFEYKNKEGSTSSAPLLPDVLVDEIMKQIIFSNAASKPEDKKSLANQAISTKALEELFITPKNKAKPKV